MRFRPEQHLRRARDIRAVREQGRRLECRAFTVWWKLRPPPAAPKSPSEALLSRVCVIASTSAVGNAVHRNHAKRRLREVFRQGQESVPSGCDLLLIARAAANEWTLPDLQKKFSEACGQIAAAVQAKT